MIATTPFWRKSTTTFLSKWEYPANSLQQNFSGRKIQFATEAHQFATEQELKSKNIFDKNTMAHKFNIGDKVLISNDFYTGKNPKLVPKFISVKTQIDGTNVVG